MDSIFRLMINSPKYLHSEKACHLAQTNPTSKTTNYPSGKLLLFSMSETIKYKEKSSFLFISA